MIVLSYVLYLFSNSKVVVEVSSIVEEESGDSGDSGAKGFREYI